MIASMFPRALAPRRWLTTATLFAFVLALAVQAHHALEADHGHADHGRPSVERSASERPQDPAPGGDHPAEGDPTCSVCLATSLAAVAAFDAVHLPAPETADHLVARPWLPPRTAPGVPYLTRGPPARGSSD